MGTSKSYGGLKGNPNWPKLSRTMTSACKAGPISKPHLNRIISNIPGIIGGSEYGGKGKSQIIGQSGIRTAQKLGSVLNEIKSKGFSSTVSGLGFRIDSNTTPSSVTNFLLEHCAGVASSLDDTAAKEAERKLLDEIGGEAKTFLDLEQNFKEVLDSYGIDELIIKFYAYYLNEHLSIGFYEKLVKDKGRENAGNLYSQLKDFLIEKLKNISIEKDLTKIDWSGSEGETLVTDIFQQTIGAFENNEN
ncbi:hypothetical protein FACS189461_2580 [Spirochaetia bacterium]|nr:hypothetical protein FACS189461_2580 [Spirochaetia bacterium]